MRTIRMIAMLAGALATLSVAGCTGGRSRSGGTTGPGPDPTTMPRTPTTGGSALPCREASCGDPRFRSALPTRSLLKIQFGSATSSSALTSSGGVAGRRESLDDVSDAYLVTEQYVADIDDFIDEVFDGLEWAASSAPIVETETEHTWRTPDELDPSYEAVLDVTTADEATFSLAYWEGAPGFDPAGAAPIVTATIAIDGAGDLVSLDLHIDLDALAAADPDSDTTGRIDIAALPLAGGLAEVRYDLVGVLVDGEIHESVTTYFVFDEGSYGLEYLASVDGAEVTVYTRWDERGGRYDDHAPYVDPELGPVDEIRTNCWGAFGEETFDAWAAIDSSGTYYGEIDGAEESCVFGPVADHPDPGGDFAFLPAPGEWDDLIAAPPPACDPESDPTCDPGV